MSDKFDKLNRTGALAKPVERRAEITNQALETFEKNFRRAQPGTDAHVVLDRLAKLRKVLAERRQLVAKVYDVGAAIADVEKRLTHLEMQQ